MRRIRVDRIAFPQDSDQVTLGTGTDAVSGQTERFVVPQNLALSVLAELHAGRHPTIEVHEFDVVDWGTWWEEVPRSSVSQPGLSRRNAAVHGVERWLAV